MNISASTELRFKELRKQADERKVWGNPELKKHQIALLLAAALPHGGQLLCWEAMRNDLSVMCLYEAVHYWCDPKEGLAAAFPNEVIQVCDYIFKNF